MAIMHLILQWHQVSLMVRCFTSCNCSWIKYPTQKGWPWWIQESRQQLATFCEQQQIRQLTITLIPDHFKKACLRRRKMPYLIPWWICKARHLRLRLDVSIPWRQEEPTPHCTTVRLTVRQLAVGTKGNGGPNTQKLTFVAKPRPRQPCQEEYHRGNARKRNIRIWFTKLLSKNNGECYEDGREIRLKATAARRQSDIVQILASIFRMYTVLVYRQYHCQKR